MRKVTELAVANFITNDAANVSGLVIAGIAQFKEELSVSDLFDPRLKTRIIDVVDVAYGGMQGLQQAIELSSESLGRLKLLDEQKVLSKFFDEIAKDGRNLYCFGAREIEQALHASVVSTLIVWDQLKTFRHTIKVGEDKERVVYSEKARLSPSDFAAPFELVDSVPLLEYLLDAYSKFGAKLELVSDQSGSGSQFVKGFGGVGALLRYEFTPDDEDEDETHKTEKDDACADVDFL